MILADSHGDTELSDTEWLCAGAQHWQVMGAGVCTETLCIIVIIVKGNLKLSLKKTQVLWLGPTFCSGRAFLASGPVFRVRFKFFLSDTSHQVPRVWRSSAARLGTSKRQAVCKKCRFCKKICGAAPDTAR